MKRLSNFRGRNSLSMNNLTGRKPILLTALLIGSLMLTSFSNEGSSSSFFETTFTQLKWSIANSLQTNTSLEKQFLMNALNLEEATTTSASAFLSTSTIYDETFSIVDKGVIGTGQLEGILVVLQMYMIV